MSKWKVEKIPNYFFSSDRLEWVAWLEGNWAECLGFRTHAEALAYADKLARTREVVLPRVGDTTQLVAHNDEPGEHPSGYHIITNDPEYSSAVQMWGPWGTMGIYKAEEIRPLALALLAHAERMGQ